MVIFPCMFANQPPKLHILHGTIAYKASAGSGKNLTLAVEYIKLLILNPCAYRQDTCRDLYQQGYGGNERAHPDAALRHLEGRPLHRMLT